MREEVEKLCSQGIQGTDDELDYLARSCGYDSNLLDFAATSLLKRGGSKASSLENPDVFKLFIQDLLQNEDKDVIFSLYNAYYVYQGGLYVKLGRQRGEFQRGLKLLAIFDNIDPFKNDSRGDPDWRLLYFKHDLALYLMEVGDIKQAEPLLRELALNNHTGNLKSNYEFVARENLCDLLILKGKVREAEYLADGILQAYESDDVVTEWGRTRHDFLYIVKGGEITQSGVWTSGLNPYARRAIARGLQGKTLEALSDFKQAECFQQEKLEHVYKQELIFETLFRHGKTGEPLPADWDKPALKPKVLIGQAAIHYAELLIRLGKLQTALHILNYSMKWAGHPHNDFPGMTVLAQLALSDIYRLLGEFSFAQRLLEASLTWASKTGQQEYLCRANLGFSRLKYRQKELDIAREYGKDALRVARQYGFQCYEIDSIVTIGRIDFCQGDLKSAHENAEDALQMTADPDWAYAWGHGNALQLYGEILFLENNLDHAFNVLSGATKIRRKIHDPRVPNTEELLDKIPPPQEEDK